MEKEKHIKLEKFLKDVGKNVRKERLAKGLSQLELASIAQIPKNQVGRIERAQINTSAFTLSLIAEALEIDIRVFFC